MSPAFPAARRPPRPLVSAARFPGTSRPGAAAETADAETAVEPAARTAAVKTAAGSVAGFARRRRHGLILGALMALAATAYSTLSLVKFATFKASVFDLVIFDQAVRGYAHFGPPAAPSVGMSYGMGMDFLQLGDHFSPILAVLAPLYWLHDDPRTLLVAQAVLLALAAIPIRRYAERRLGTVPAHLVAAAYLVSWPVAQAAGFDFHEVAFVPLLSAIMIERFDAGRPAWGVVAAAGLLLVKEDMGLLVAGFGAYLFLTRRRLEGAAFVFFSLGALVMIRGVLMPMAGSPPAGFHWAYGAWGTSLGEVVLAVARDPAGALWQMVSPEVKVDTLAFLLWPVLLTALASPLTLVAVPLVVERFLSDRQQWWGTDFQYNAFVVAILFCAGADGVHRLRGRFAARRERRAGEEAAGRPEGERPEVGGTDDERPEVGRTDAGRPGTGRSEAGSPGEGRSEAGSPEGGTPAGNRSVDGPVSRRVRWDPVPHWAVAILVVGLTLVPKFALGNLVESSFYEGEPHVAAAREAVAAVPDGVVVEAVNSVGPALTARTTVLLWGPQSHNAPWVVADVARWSYPFGDFDSQRRRVDEALVNGYRKVYDRDGYIVLNRPS
ncbi:DUF2079 domain-containing protein [Streptosporangium pseudovulgare]|uniref:DUF2079 domain-containing protein n=1 Tax=Streptosporangium pseudovulgare TaxID=35765 RepID=A0ABQ2QY40_9ACTN|nr:DUF2079 domain-containing protein [Streptosporangium pseudovulgare]GGQ03897.1 hypothetical protein GCM10010140_37470 [Streptosporangium pseudovulgare]